MCYMQSGFLPCSLVCSTTTKEPDFKEERVLAGIEAETQRAVPADIVMKGTEGPASLLPSE